MRWRVFFIISACVNAGLFAAWLHARKPAAPTTTATGPATTNTQFRTHVVVRRQFFSWNEIESTDYSTYIANLRDIGCPEQTIRDIIIADVNALFAKKREQELRTAGQQWWRTTLAPEVLRKLRALDDERRALLTKLLGAGWDPNAATTVKKLTPLPLDGPVLGMLPDDVKARINEVVAASQQRMADLVAQAAAEGRQPSGAEMAAVREQTRTELQKILTPPQLEEFLLRFSQNAIDLRTELGGLGYFKATPEEFRALFRARDPFDEKIAALQGSTDPNDLRQLRSLEQQRENAIRQALGSKRYELYRQLHDSTYRSAYAQAAAAGVPGAVGTLYQLNQATQAELDRIKANSNLTPEQLAVESKRVELEQAEASTAAVGQDIPPDPDAPPEPPPPPQNRTHIIRSGETLGALSTAYGVPVNMILDANPGLQFNNLRVGQSIIIPPAPTR
ncbi:MAG TPA: LysM domain-containing protein [Verrucomicrobiae bacterium]|nr:LysM domain-containing protein [Verrucomicrobiae bacterium]